MDSKKVNLEKNKFLGCLFCIVILLFIFINLMPDSDENQNQNNKNKSKKVVSPGTKDIIKLPNYKIIETLDYSHGAASRLKVIAMTDSMIFKRDIYLLLKEITNKYISNYDIVSVFLLPNQGEDYQAIATSEYSIPSKNEWRTGLTGGDTIINGLDIKWEGHIPFYYKRIENLIPDNEKKLFSIKYKVYGEPVTVLLTYQDKYGKTQLEKVNLPWEYSFNAKQGTHIAMSAQCYPDDPGNIIMILLIDGLEIKKSESIKSSMSSTGYMGPLISIEL